jgi:uncharacterized protein YutD
VWGKKIILEKVFNFNFKTSREEFFFVHIESKRKYINLMKKFILARRQLRNVCISCLDFSFLCSISTFFFNSTQLTSIWSEVLCNFNEIQESFRSRKCRLKVFLSKDNTTQMFLLKSSNNLCQLWRSWEFLFLLLMMRRMSDFILFCKGFKLENFSRAHKVFVRWLQF